MTQTCLIGVRKDSHSFQELPKEKRLALTRLKIPALGDTSKFAGALCKALFGPDSIKPNSGDPKDVFRQAVDALARRAWERYRRQLYSTVNLGDKGKKEFAAAFAGKL